MTTYRSDCNFCPLYTILLRKFVTRRFKKGKAKWKKGTENKTKELNEANGCFECENNGDNSEMKK